MGVFNYLKRGFKKQPVTHMYGIIDRVAQKEIGHKGSNTRICQGVKLTVTYLLEHALRFIKTYHKLKKNYFGFFWESSITHDDINYDPKLDQILEKFFIDIALSGALENAFMFVLSDHGIRWGKILTTHQGRLEERLPFLFIIPPRKWAKKYYSAHKNLKENAKKLTTPFDMHETLVDILNRDYLNLTSFGRGVSLFRPVSLERNCDTAGIPPHWCTCQDTISIDVTDEVIRFVSTFVVQHINNLLVNHTNCAKVILEKVLDASISSRTVSNEKQLNPVYYYTVVLQSKFVGAIFEATVKCSRCNMQGDIKMAGEVSRNNQYGHQGDCINDSKLRLYCYCKM